MPHRHSTLGQFESYYIPVTWNLEAFPRTSPLSIRLDPNTAELVRGVVGTPDGNLPLEEVKSVWLRENMFGLFAPRRRADDMAVFSGPGAGGRISKLGRRSPRWILGQCAACALLDGIGNFSTTGRCCDWSVRAAESQSDGPFAELHDRRRGPSKRVHRQYALPPFVEAACLRLMENWGLVFGEVHMIRRPDGEQVFLASRANPEWLWLERATG